MEYKQANAGEEQEFYPRGAIAFFVAMATFYAVLWLTLFAVMAGRS